MVFNDTSTKLGLCQDADFGLGTDTNSYPLADKTRNANERFKMIWSWIFESYGGAIFDDGNQTDLPQSVGTLTSGQTTYPVPSGTLAIEGVEVKNTSGIWIKLVPITAEQIRERNAMGEFQKTSATPIYYRVIGETIQIYPAANWTQSSSFKVFYNRGISEFASTDTTKQPGFASPFHRAISIGMQLDYAIKNPQIGKREILELEWSKWEKAIKNFYSTRFKEMFPAQITVKDALREAM